MFTQEEIRQIEAHGLTVDQVKQQIENFRAGFPALPIVRAASCGDGIRKFNEEEIANILAHYDTESSKIRCVKFVPASGAATRMFKELFEYVNDDKRTAGIDKLITNLEKFAFFAELAKYLYPQIDDKDVVRNIIIDGLCYVLKKYLINLILFFGENLKWQKRSLSAISLTATLVPLVTLTTVKLH